MHLIENDILQLRKNRRFNHVRWVQSLNRITETSIIFHDNPNEFIVKFIGMYVIYCKIHISDLIKRRVWISAILILFYTYSIYTI